jgi:hypothetical protein
MSKAKKLSRDGLPVDPKEWTKADWQDLHEAMEKAKRLISKRHKPEPSSE